MQDNPELHELDLITFDTIEASFHSAKSSVFRLEVLQNYSVEYELEEFNKFKATGSISPKFMADWTEMVSSIRQKGVAFGRVRFVKYPLTQYSKYEFECFRSSQPNGEEIRLLDVTDTEASWHIKAPLFFDYWLFDDQYGYFMIYDVSGSYIGAAKIPSDMLHYYVKIKNEAISESLPFS